MSIKLWYNLSVKINKITVRNYRNLASQTVMFDNGLNILYGNNAQGKTNLIESVYLCAIGKSVRTEKNKDLVQWGQSVAHVKLEYSCRYGDGQISVGISTDKRKKAIAVNSVPINKTGELLGYVNCVYFSPNEIKIVSQSPQERRKFLDVDLCQTDKNYFYSLQRFNKALLQRNNLIKQTNDSKRIQDVIFVWDNQLAEEGAKIIYKRRKFCDKLKVVADATHKKLTDGKESLQIEYVTQIKGDSVQELQQNYLEQLQNTLQKDMQLRYTTVGCQRDDITLCLAGKELRQYGSQGQQRTTALSLKLAEMQLMHDIIGEYPILLLDDVLSELDEERQRRLLSFSDKAQILLTTATLPDNSLLPDNYTLFYVQNGKITLTQQTENH